MTREPDVSESSGGRDPLSYTLTLTVNSKAAPRIPALHLAYEYDLRYQSPPLSHLPSRSSIITLLYLAAKEVIGRTSSYDL